jgi:HlyD family secretion protein
MNLTELSSLQLGGVGLAYRLFLIFTFCTGCDQFGTGYEEMNASREKGDAPVVVTGLVDAVEIDVASKVPGRISGLLVREGDTVKKGQELVTLSTDEIDAKMYQVDAAIDAAKAQLKLARKGAKKQEKEAVRKQVDAARHQVEITKKMYDRLKPLADAKAVAGSKFDEVEFKYKVAQDQLAMAEARLSIVMDGARKEQIEALDALVKKAEGVQAEVESYKRESSQVAPISGVVSKVVLHKGELAATGYPILTIVDLSDQWAVFTVREDMLKSISVGRMLKAKLPALNKTISLKVFNISAMGDFATWKATSEKNSFDLKSFEVKARPVEPVQNLRPGMSVQIRIK